MSSKLTTKIFIEKANAIHGNRYDYSQVEYVNSTTKINIICPVHGSFKQSPSNHTQKSRSVGCPQCGSVRFRRKKTLTTKMFIEKANTVHGNKYDYSLVDYIHNSKSITIVCPVHGTFQQRAMNHLQGYGCKKCANDKARIGTELFINRAVLVHGDVYNYSSTVYERTDVPVYIECKIHGIFLQTPNSHLAGCGCPSCGILKASTSTTLTTQKFIQLAKQLHGDAYDYSAAHYVNTKTKISIICPKHGEFHQQPNMHLQGQRCPKCRGNISIIESSWLDYCGVPNTRDTRQCNININGKRYRVDGYCKETNTVYEFWGDFWHGNPSIFDATDINPITKKTYGDLFNDTQKKKQQIIDAGYTLVDIWEYDWIQFLKHGSAE